MAASNTEMGGPDTGFPSTIWSRVTQADPEGRQAGASDLEKLIGRYWKPVYCYIRHGWSKSSEDAKDLTQQFFLEDVLERGLLERYDPGKGSFRGFLKGALGNFMGHAVERSAARKRGGLLKILSLDGGPEEAAAYLPDDKALAPDRVFDDVWKRIVLETAAERTRQRCRKEGKEVVFEVFRRYDLEPDAPDVSYKTLGQSLGLSPDTVKNHLTRARDCYLEAVSELVRETVRSPEDLSRELRELFGL